MIYLTEINQEVDLNDKHICVHCQYPVCGNYLIHTGYYKVYIMCVFVMILKTSARQLLKEGFAVKL